MAVLSGHWIVNVNVRNLGISYYVLDKNCLNELEEKTSKHYYSIALSEKVINFWLFVELKEKTIEQTQCIALLEKGMNF